MSDTIRVQQMLAALNSCSSKDVHIIDLTATIELQPQLTKSSEIDKNTYPESSMLTL